MYNKRKQITENKNEIFKFSWFVWRKSILQWSVVRVSRKWNEKTNREGVFFAVFWKFLIVVISSIIRYEILVNEPYEGIGKVIFSIFCLLDNYLLNVGYFSIYGSWLKSRLKSYISICYFNDRVFLSYFFT